MSDSEPETGAGPAEPAQEVNIGSASDFPALPVAAKPVFAAAPAWAARPTGSSGPGASSGGAARPAAASPATSGVSEVFSLPPQSLDPKVRAQGAADAVKEVHRQVPGSEVKVSTQTRTGVLTFVIKAKNKDDLARARRLVGSSCGLRTAVRFTIPSSVRPHLIGAQGRTLKALVAKCLVEVQIPKQAPKTEGESPLLDDDEEETEITITGDAEGIEMARKEIEAVVLQRAAKSTGKIAVPIVYHPFLQQAAASIMDDSQAKIHIPPPSNKTDEEIIIQGDRDAVRKATMLINQLQEDWKKFTTTMKVAIPKKQHRYLLGSKASNLQDILEKTGCSVEVPPADVGGTEGDEVIVRGPSEKLISAVTLVLEKANAFQSDTVDMAALLSRKSNAEVFSRYISSRERGNIRKIESEHEGVEIRLHGTVVDVTAKSKASLQAAVADLKKYLQPLAAGLEFDSIEIPHALHGHIVGKGGSGVSRLRTKIDEALGTDGALVDLVIPRKDDEESDGEGADEIVVVAKSIGGRKDIMEQIKGEIQRQIETMADFASLPLSLDQKYHGRIIGSGGTSLKKLLAPYEGAVSVKFPAPNASPADASTVIVRGPKDKVGEVVKKLKEMGDEWKHQEIMCSFSEDVKVPKDSAKRILGAQREDGGLSGAWIIRAIKEKVASLEKSHAAQLVDRDINMTRFDIASTGDKGDVITVTGHKRAVELAKEIILDRGQKLADTVIVPVTIPAKYHSKLIGKGGKVVGKLMELYNVFVKFPSKGNANGTAEEGEHEDDKVDEDRVTIRGFTADVEKAKEELLALAAYEEAHSHSLTFTVPGSLLPRIVGRKGQTVHLIKEETDTRIDFDRPAGEEGEGDVTVTIEGPKEGCATAKKKIMEIVNEQLDIVEHHMTIPRRLHRVLIGHSGVAIRNLVAQWAEDLGISSERIQIRFPKDEGEDVLIRTSSKVLDKVISLLEAEVKKHEALLPHHVEGAEGQERIEEEILIPKTDVARVVGRKGETITNIGLNRGVEIQIAQGKEDLGESVGVKISGYSQEAIDGAKGDILSKLRASESISVPELVLLFIENDRGRFRGSGGGDGGPVGIDFEGDKIVIRGDRAAVDATKASVSKRVDELAKYAKSGYVVIPSSVRAHVIGRQGATINRIRKESECMVDIFPAEKVKETKGHFAVVVLGENEEAVSKGKALIEKIVKDQAQDAASSAGGSTRDEAAFSKRISVPTRLHGRLIGPKGSGIAEIQAQVGLQVNVQFPRAGTSSTELEIKGSPAAVEKCIKVIRDLVANLDESVIVKVIDEGAAAAAAADRAKTPDVTRPPSSQGRHSPAPTSEGPPGWSGRAAATTRRVPPPAPAVINEPEFSSAPAPSAVQQPTKQDEEWKVIGKKATKAAVAAAATTAAATKAAEAIPGTAASAAAQDGGSSSASGSKKKKKAKKTDDLASTEVPFGAASSSFSLAPASPTGDWADDTSFEPVAINGAGQTTATPSAAASSSAPAPAPASAPASAPPPAPAPAPAAPVDEWKTVNTVQKFKQKKIAEAEEAKKPAAPAAPSGPAPTSQRNVYGVLEEPAGPSSSGGSKKSKKK